MKLKVKINKRDNEMYPYGIGYMNREDVLLKENELLEIYDQITEYICNDESLLRRLGWENFY